MSTVHGGVAGSIGAQAQQTSQKVQAIKPIGQENSTPAQRTQGSVFNQSPAFLQLTMSTRMQGSPVDNTRVATNQPKQSTNIGNMLNGKFTDLTMQGRNNNGNMSIQAKTDSRNKDQDQTKTSDEMLAVANNLTMKDMWAAA